MASCRLSAAFGGASARWWLMGAGVRRVFRGCLVAVRAGFRWIGIPQGYGCARVLVTRCSCSGPRSPSALAARQHSRAQRLRRWWPVGAEVQGAPAFRPRCACAGDGRTTRRCRVQGTSSSKQRCAISGWGPSRGSTGASMLSVTVPARGGSFRVFRRLRCTTRCGWCML